jgi:hypothetical protein
MHALHAVTGLPFGGTLSFAQFDRIQQVLLPWWMRKWVVIPFVLYASIFGDREWQVVFGNPVVWMAGLFVGAVILLVMWGLVRFARRRAWKQVVALNGAISGSAGVEGIDWNTALTQARFPWTKFIKLRKRSDLVLLYYLPRCALYFPRAFFGSEEAWTAFGALADAQLARSS